MERVTRDAITGLSAQALEYAVSNYGERTGVGIPRFVAGRAVIEFPLLCYAPPGYLEVGTLRLDSTGSVLSAPSREELARTAENRIARLTGSESPSTPAQAGEQRAARR